jgi:hypothetical protein
VVNRLWLSEEFSIFQQEFRYCLLSIGLVNIEPNNFNSPNYRLFRYRLANISAGTGREEHAAILLAKVQIHACQYPISGHTFGVEQLSYQMGIILAKI